MSWVQHVTICLPSDKVGRNRLSDAITDRNLPNATAYSDFKSRQVFELRTQIKSRKSLIYLPCVDCSLAPYPHSNWQFYNLWILSHQNSAFVTHPRCLLSKITILSSPYVHQSGYCMKEEADCQKDSSSMVRGFRPTCVFNTILHRCQQDIPTHLLVCTGKRPNNWSSRKYLPSTLYIPRSHTK